MLYCSLAFGELDRFPNASMDGSGELIAGIARFGASRRSDLIVLYVTRDETYAANDEDVSP